MFELVKSEYKVVPIKTKIRSYHFEGGQKPVMEDVQSDLNLLGKEDGNLSASKTSVSKTAECSRSPTLRNKKGTVQKANFKKRSAEIKF
jgi:hypothetical protein